MTTLEIDLDQPPLSPAARSRIESELAVLRTERETLAATLVADADPVGDAADRADVLTGYEELDRLDLRIEEILVALARPVRVDPPAFDVIGIGTTVTLRYGGGSPEVVVLADLLEDDGEIELVTPRSPLGQALLGRAVGDEVTYRAPSGEVRVVIEAIGGRAA